MTEYKSNKPGGVAWNRDRPLGVLSRAGQSRVTEGVERWRTIWGVARSLGTALLLAPLTSCGDFFITREAVVAARIATADGRTGVPCTVVALLFGDEDSRLTASSGSSVALKIGMLTPLATSADVKARVALRVECQGYRVITSPEREVEVALLRTPRLELGTVTSSLP